LDAGLKTFQALQDTHHLEYFAEFAELKRTYEEKALEIYMIYLNSLSDAMKMGERADLEMFQERLTQVHYQVVQTVKKVETWRAKMKADPGTFCMMNIYKRWVEDWWHHNGEEMLKKEEVPILHEMKYVKSQKTRLDEAREALSGKLFCIEERPAKVRKTADAKIASAVIVETLHEAEMQLPYAELEASWDESEAESAWKALEKDCGMQLTWG